MTQRKICLVLTAFLLLAPVYASAENIRIGTDGEFPPFNSVDQNGSLVGFNIDLGDALCSTMKLECEWITSSWQQLIPSLLDNRIDVILASMSITTERKEIISFTDKYYVSPIRFIRRKGTSPTPSDSANKLIGVQVDSISEQLIRDKFSSAVIKTYAEQLQANLDLVSGRLDLVAADAFVLMEFLLSDEGIDAEFVGQSIVDPDYLGEGIGMGVRKEDEELKQKLNQALLQIRKDGTYQRINARYFDFDIFGD